MKKAGQGKTLIKALREYHDGSEHGWNLMFSGLKKLVETGEIDYPSK